MDGVRIALPIIPTFHHSNIPTFQPALLHRLRLPGHGFVRWCPALPGCSGHDVLGSRTPRRRHTVRDSRPLRLESPITRTPEPPLRPAVRGWTLLLDNHRRATCRLSHGLPALGHGCHLPQERGWVPNAGSALKIQDSGSKTGSALKIQDSG